MALNGQALACWRGTQADSGQGTGVSKNRCRRGRRRVTNARLGRRRTGPLGMSMAVLVLGVVFEKHLRSCVRTTSALPHSAAH
eukprot:15459478-Alexandrium_andersonii.AAC.1